MELEVLLPLAGGAGRFQWMTVVLLSFVHLFTNLENLMVNFLSPLYPYWCNIPALGELTPEEQRQIAMPFAIFTSNGYESCLVKDYNWDNYTENDRFWLEGASNITSITCPYAQYAFDPAVFRTTATSEWNLVCDKKHILNLISPVYTTGLLIGAFACGAFSDRFGRLTTLLVVTCIHIVAGVAAALAVNEWMYIIARMCVAFAVRGGGLSGIVLLTEMFVPRYRMRANMGYAAFFALGGLVLVLFAYFIRHFRYLQGAVLIPVLFMLSYWWIIPESPRWLLARGRAREAADVIQRMARINGRVIPDHIMEQFVQYHNASTASTQPAMKATILDILRHPTLRKHSMICNVLMTSGLFLYLAISLNLSNLFGNIFTNVTINSTIEVPAYVLLYFSLDKFGRRNTYIVTLSLAVALCGAAVVILAIGETPALKMTVTILHILVRVAGSCGFGVMTIYTAELFPTTIRQAALGIANAFAALVGIVASFVGGPMKEIWIGLPSVVYLVLTTVSVGLCFFLPETRNKPLPETIEDVCRLKDRKRKSTLNTVSGIVDNTLFDCKVPTIAGDGCNGVYRTKTEGVFAAYTNYAYQSHFNDLQAVTRL